MNDLIIQAEEASVIIKASGGTHEMYLHGDLETLVQYARDTNLDGHEGTLTERVTVTFTRLLPAPDGDCWFALASIQDEVVV